MSRKNLYKAYSMGFVLLALVSMIYSVVIINAHMTIMSAIALLVSLGLNTSQ